MANQIQSVTAGTEIVTITIGGNDIGFSNLIVQCTLSDCSSALDNTRASLTTVLGPRLDTVYAAMQSRTLTATVVVLGYPRIFSSAGCFGTLGISATERAKANLLADAIDAAHGCASRRDGAGAYIPERDRGFQRARGLLGERLAQRPQSVQHRRELPPQSQRQQPRVRTHRALGSRLAARKSGHEHSISSTL